MSTGAYLSRWPRPIMRTELIRAVQLFADDFDERDVTDVTSRLADDATSASLR
ncbi:hypothetical protein [Streptomyces altiplanensis]